MKFPEPFRITVGPMRSDKGDAFGFFHVPYESFNLRVMASSGDEEMRWEHVSVSLPNRCPSWKEMDHIKRMFWDDEEAVMQLHPPRSEWVNNHAYCLHLWRPLDEKLPLPPAFAVGLKGVELVK
jgi:hypothetical protein